MIDRIDKPSDSFFTPNWLVDEILEFYDGTIDLDPAADSDRKNRLPANRHYTFEDNGLESKWFGKVYCNPPYSRSKSTSLDLWAKKALISQACCQSSQCLLLLPVNTDTKWGQLLLRKAWGSSTKISSLILFFEGRISFLNAKYEPSKGSGRFASMMVYLGENQHRFKRDFSKYGVIL